MANVKSGVVGSIFLMNELDTNIQQNFPLRRTAKLSATAKTKE